MQQINFYRNRVAINVLAKDIANAGKSMMLPKAMRRSASSPHSLPQWRTVFRR